MAKRVEAVKKVTIKPAIMRGVAIVNPKSGYVECVTAGEQDQSMVRFTAGANGYHMVKVLIVDPRHYTVTPRRTPARAKVRWYSAVNGLAEVVDSKYRTYWKNGAVSLWLDDNGHWPRDTYKPVSASEAAAQIKAWKKPVKPAKRAKVGK